MKTVLTIIFVLVLMILSFITGLHYGDSNAREVLSSPGFHSKKLIPEQKCQESLDEAKKYYGKAFLLFLTNIGVMLSSNQTQELNTLMTNPKDYQRESFPKDNEKTASSNTEVVILPDYLSNKPFQEFLKKQNIKIDHIDDKNLVNKNSNFVLKDPGVFYVRSKFIKSYQQISPLNGLYAGKLYLFSGKDKGETHDIEMTIEFNQKSENENEKDQIDGNFNLKISEDGNIYSNSRGNGGNGDVRMNQNSLIIEASPSSFFHFEQSSINTANYYDNNQLIGFARFRKLD